LFGGNQSNLYLYVGNNPIDYYDPTGLFLPWQHRNMSFISARRQGFSFYAAQRIAEASVEADFIRDSQTEASVFTAIHAMSGYDHNLGRYQTRKEAKLELLKFAKNMVKIANAYKRKGDCESYYTALGYALHAIQDQWSPLHNFSEWHSTWIGGLEHFFTHFFGGTAEENMGAYRSSALFLRGEILKSLRP
jgi:hypothetical protein